MKLNWAEIGNSDASTTIVFLHEGLGCIEMWKGYPNKVCAGLGVKGIVYDRQGYGKSPGSFEQRDSNYLHEGAHELNELINHLEIEDFILYGHSDGGSIALIYAAIYPSRLLAVITEAAHVFNEKKTIEGVKEMRPLLAGGKMDGLKKYHGTNYKDVFYAWNDIWTSKAFEDWNITKLLHDISCPVLSIQGANDKYGTVKQIEVIHEKTNDLSQKLWVDDCGHSPHKEQETKVLNEVLNFIDGII